MRTVRVGALAIAGVVALVLGIVVGRALKSSTRSDPPERMRATRVEATRARVGLVDIPVPRPGPGEVLVRVHAAAVNPVDALIALPLTGTTAWHALIELGRIGPGSRVLIHGAAGGVGVLAVQIAKARGAHVIATASARRVSVVRSLGADLVIDDQARRFEEVARDVDVVLDVIGGDVLARSWGVLKPGGLLVSLIDTPRAPAGKRGATFLVAPHGAVLREIGALVHAGALRPVVSAVLPLAEAQQALSSKRGKIVLQVRP